MTVEVAWPQSSRRARNPKCIVNPNSCQESSGCASRKCENLPTKLDKAAKTITLSIGELREHTTVALGGQTAAAQREYSNEYGFHASTRHHNKNMTVAKNFYLFCLIILIGVRIGTCVARQGRTKRQTPLLPATPICSSGLLKCLIYFSKTIPFR